MNPPPEFGNRVTGVLYRPRPGSYAVIRGDGDLIAILRTPQGLFLPGGGIDAGESPEAALHREALEEIGHAIEVVRPLGFAIEYVFAKGERYFAKHCHFFEAKLGPRVTDQHETDHELHWRPLAVAISELTDGSQSWAVCQVASS